MSDTEGSPKGKTGWSDKERLGYIFALIEQSKVKFDFNGTPRPTGRSVIACQRMFERFKLEMKPQVEALKSGQPIDEATPKKTAGTPKTPRKRKNKNDGEGDGNATPTKRGRKQKDAAEQIEDDEEPMIKPEIEDEDAEV